MSQYSSTKLGEEKGPLLEGGRGTLIGGWRLFSILADRPGTLIRGVTVMRNCRFLFFVDKQVFPFCMYRSMLELKAAKVS